MEVKLKDVIEKHPVLSESELVKDDDENIIKQNYKILNTIIKPMIYNILAIQNSDNHKYRKNIFHNFSAGIAVKKVINSDKAVFVWKTPPDSEVFSAFRPEVDICGDHFRLIKDMTPKLNYESKTFDPEYDREYRRMFESGEYKEEIARIIRQREEQGEEMYIREDEEPNLQARVFRNFANSGQYGTSLKAYLKGTDIPCRVKINTYEEFLNMEDIDDNNSPMLFYGFIREIYYGLRYINPFISILPNFMETYGLYYCPSTDPKSRECLNIKNFYKFRDLFTVTEQIDNEGSLSSFIQNEDINPDVDVVLSLIYQVACALELLERYNINHGDCHTYNILVQKTDIESYQFPEKDGTTRKIYTRGYLARIIDYGLVGYKKNQFDVYHEYNKDDISGARKGMRKPDSRVFIDFLLRDIKNDEDETSKQFKYIEKLLGPPKYFNTWESLKQEVEKDIKRSHKN